MDISSMVGAVVRAGLQVAAGSAVMAGVLDGDTINVVVGAVTALVTVGWSIFQKVKAKK